MANKNGGLTRKAYETIKERLVKCEYPPNTLLNEGQLSSSLGFSRTPTREAIIQLEQEGFLKVIPKKGIYVTAITANDIIQIFQVRREIEPITLMMSQPYIEKDILLDFKDRFSATETSVINSYQLDTAMHLYLIENCRNAYIIDMMHKVYDKNTRVIIASKQNQMHIHDSRKEHVEILNSLLNEQYEQAAKQLVDHIEHCRMAAFENFYLAQPGCSNYEITYKQYLDESSSSKETIQTSPVFR